jgi:hypothetical protein
MGRNVLILLRARRGLLAPPYAAWLAYGGIAAFVTGLVRDGYEPFPYALLALSTVALLLTLALLGELGSLLRAEPADEWVGALPVTRRERALARGILTVSTIELAALGPIAAGVLLAPSGWSWAARAGLAASGLALGLALAAAFVVLHALAGRGLERLLLAAHAALAVAVALGLVLGVQSLPRLAHLSPEDCGWFPLTWLAAPFSAESRGAASPWPAGLAALAAAGALWLAPAPAPPRAARAARGTGRLLAPIAALARRAWVARPESAGFELVWAALPREREFVQRTVPLAAVPFALVLAAALGEPGAERDGLLALLCFLPAVWTPVLLAQLPCSAWHEAHWLLALAPVERDHLDSGARKALVARFLVPLYVLLGAIAWQQVGLGFALRVVPAAFLGSAFALRLLHATVAGELPLSRPPEELRFESRWTNAFWVIAFALAFAAAGAAFTPWFGPLLALLLGSTELAASRPGGARWAALDPARWTGGRG